MEFFKQFKDFQPHEIEERKLRATIGGEVGGGDTGTTSHIELTHGTTGLDNYSDPVYNDGNKGDWTDKDVCK